MKKFETILSAIIKSQADNEYSLFEISPSEQENYLNSLPEPKDLIGRSYLQYQCQKFFFKNNKKVKKFLLACAVYPLFFIISLIKGVRVRKKYHIDAIGNFKTLAEVIPNNLSREYSIDSACYGYSFSLNVGDLPFIFKLLVKFPFSPFFQLKCLMNLARYSKMIHSYTPRAIINHSEFSFTASVLTQYCRIKGVKHINVMHGEKLYYIRDSFFCYDECYVWHEHYKKLFIDLRSEASQFKIEVPSSLSFDPKKYKDERVYADIKYYLADETEEEIKSIVSCMARLKEKGFSIKYRPHPTYSSISLLMKYIDSSEIELNKDVSIQLSLSNLRCAVGSYSTTMLQAFLTGKQVALDDVTFPSRYLKLKKMNYMLANEPTCTTLSNLVQ